MSLVQVPKTMYERILVATDGSEHAGSAVLSALSLARRFDAELHGIYVLDVSEVPDAVIDDTRPLLSEHGKAALAGVREAGSEMGIEPETTTVEASGPIHEAIIETATDRNSDLIVLGSHGRSGLERVLLGSVAERTIRHAPTPVMTVKDRSLEGIDRLLVATDGSPGATAAADHAVELAASLDASLHVISVVDVTAFASEIGTPSVYEEFEQIGQDAVDDVIDRAEAAGVSSIEAAVVSGRPSSAILDYADDREVDLAVLGTHGRSGLDRYLIGSVAERVVRFADIPVTTVNERVIG